MFVTALAATLRLIALTYPAGLVFDEVYYFRSIRTYVCGDATFHTGHPPLASLLAAASARLFAFSCDTHAWTIGARVSQADAFAGRVAFAVAGTATVSLVFGCIVVLGGSRRAATIGALALALDNAHLVQSRTAAPDAFLLMFEMAALLVAARLSSPVERRGQYLVLLGLLVGAAGLVKVTGYAIAAPCLLLAFGSGPRSRVFGEAALVAGAGLALSILVFAVHFRVSRVEADVSVSGADIIRKIVAYQKVAAAIHRSAEVAVYPGSSKWFQWPLDRDALYLWRSSSGREHLILVGNPVVWWGTSVLVVAMLASHASRAIHGSSGERTCGVARQRILLLGFLAAYLPHMCIKRVMFMYHYLPAMCIGIVAVSLWADSWRPRKLGRRSGLVDAAVCMCLVAGFAAFVPVTFGLRVPSCFLAHTRLLVPQAVGWR